MTRSFLPLLMCLSVIACSQASETKTEAETKVKAEMTTVTASAIEAEAGWVVSNEASKVSFKGMMSGEPFDGHFKMFNANISLDPENLDTASIQASIDMSSAQTGDADKDDALPGKEWFNVKKFPEATFVSSDIQRNEEGMYIAAGDLQIKETTLPVILPFSLDITDGIAKADGTLRINRTDYAIGTGSWASDQWIALGVNITIHIEASRP